VLSPFPWIDFPEPRGRTLHILSSFNANQKRQFGFPEQSNFLEVTKAHVARTPVCPSSIVMICLLLGSATAELRKAILNMPGNSVHAQVESSSKDGRALFRFPHESRSDHIPERIQAGKEAVRTFCSIPFSRNQSISGGTCSLAPSVVKPILASKFCHKLRAALRSHM